MINKEILKQAEGQVRQYLNGLGYPENEIQKQLLELKELIVLSFIKRIAEDDGKVVPVSQISDQEQMDNYIKQHYTEQDLANIYLEESKKLVDEYFLALH